MSAVLFAPDDTILWLLLANTTDTLELAEPASLSVVTLTRLSSYQRTHDSSRRCVDDLRVILQAQRGCVCLWWAALTLFNAFNTEL